MYQYTRYFSVLVAIIALCSIGSCKKETLLPPLSLTMGIADSSIFNVDTAIQLSANIPVIWKFTRANSGTLTPSAEDEKTITYRTPKTAGVYTLRILNQADTTEKIIRTVIVTPLAGLFNDLRNGGYVLSFRHALANTGGDQLSSPIPNWWRSCESTIARQLDVPAGRVQAEKTGKALKLLKIPVGKIISSEYCRCLQTVQFMNLGVGIETSRFLTYYVYDEANRYTDTFSLVRQQPISRQNIIFSTHVGFSFIPPTANRILANLNMGDAAVFRLRPNGAEPTVVQILTSADLTGLVN